MAEIKTPSTKWTQIDGDLSASRHIVAGGDVCVRGRAIVDHDLDVGGNITAINIQEIEEKLKALPDDIRASVEEQIAEIVEGAPDAFKTLKELTDALTEAEKSGTLQMGSLLKLIQQKADKATTLEGYGIKDGVNSVVTHGSGNAVTDVSVSGHRLNVTKADTFLHSDRDDVAHGHITLEQGVQIGTATLPGQRSIIDRNGDAELRSLRLSSFLEVPEYRRNRITITTGVQWITFGGGLVESVAIDHDAHGNALQSGVVTLKIEKGEVGTIDVDDLAHGIYHNAEGGNEAETKDDRHGNFRVAGFQSVYFRIDEIVSTDGSRAKFRYVLRSGWPHHPQEGMRFACYANTSNPDRQHCMYWTTEYFISLGNMTTWEYGGSNIYGIWGKLEGFEVNGKKFHGYGQVLGNVYMYGSIEQWTNAPLRLEFDTGGDTLLGNAEEKEIIVYAMRGFEDVTDQVTAWTVSRETSDGPSDLGWNSRHKDFAGTLTITDKDLSLTDRRTLFRFTATIDSNDVTGTMGVQ